MTEIIGDAVIPSELIIPDMTGTVGRPALSGAMWISGGTLYFYGNSGSTGIVIEVGEKG